ncbi:hypothetical protein [Nocardia sp. NBC_01388]|uniref:hypothetical protein n=1 Tax=Nocardia sp. NBC_01388 TaxID=2903596 RepID=UPI00324A8DB7
MNPSARWALVGLGVLVLVAVAVTVSLLIGGVHDLTHTATCGGAVMAPIDGCEVLRGHARGDHDVHLYWPGGLMKGMSDSSPRDLRSQAQMQSHARSDGRFEVFTGSAILIALAYAPVRWTIRRWRRPHATGKRGR